jgi:hypothetical protein
MKRTTGILLLLTGSAAVAMAGATVAVTPEIDPATAVGALVLIAGGLAVIRGRRRKT